MFKDEFKRELEQVAPQTQTQNEILDKIKAATEKEPKRRLTVKIKRLRFTAAVAAMVAISLISASVLWPTPPVTNNITPSDEPLVAKAESYESIYTLFNTIYEKQHPKPSFTDKVYSLFSNGLKGTDDLFVEEDAMEESVDIEYDMGIGTTGTIQNENAVDDGEGAKDYSDTNTQVNDVDEADIIKTDGKYIYIIDIGSGQLKIVKANKGQVSTCYTMRLNAESTSNSINYNDMYVVDDRLIIIGMQYKENPASQYTIAEFYDIKNPEKPLFINRLSQSGNLISTRLTDNKLYVFSNQTYYSKPKKEDVSSYVPITGCGDDLQPVSLENIHIFDGEIDRQYLIIGSADINSVKHIDIKTALGGGDAIYANTKSIYAAKADNPFSYTDGEKEENFFSKTGIIRFEIQNGKIVAAAKAEIKGQILNQFSMDETGDYFRIVTTVEEYNKENSKYYITTDKTHNSLYVLNKNLEQVGAIENLAPDERVYSVRFMGNTAYFVTFRQVDPLFAVDLTDPKNPKVLSALKIPGFSNYLHPYSDGLLLGIGKNADQETGSTGTVKLSMFDISNPSNVTENHKTSLDCFYSQADSNHKAVTIDKGKNIIAFMGSDYYYVYGYTQTAGFYLRAKLNVVGNYHSGVRGIYIGNVFYVCCEDSVASYDINTFKKISEITV